MNRPIAKLLALAVFVCSPTGINAANHVYVESKTVVAGARNVEVGIYISNIPAVALLHMPFEIREVTPGSFIADTIEFSAGGRLLGNLHTPMSLQYFATQEDSFGVVGCWWTRSYPDFVSPDMVHYVSLRGLVNTNLCLPSGTDGVPPYGDDWVNPDASPSLKLRFDVTSVPGVFEIDSSCVGTDALRFAACYGHTIFTPEFTKGIITIVPCACQCHGDPVCDGIYNVMDVLAVIDEAFGARSPISDSECGRKTRADLNCDCQVSIVDVVKIIDVILRGKVPESVLCDGCSSSCP